MMKANENRKTPSIDSLEQKQKKAQPSEKVNLTDKKLSGSDRPST
ncbi:hypothetical protein GCM10010965_20530 [Caldalkalibacillus thermarum]|nr:hypothetical protein [Caldalkalibacillus thermarum]GGK27607.1 hypothetical protein GCM10010965_20530 [Caldalkalibacillus thermarum]